MTRGRKPTPTEIKELQGTAQPCRTNKFEPKLSERISDNPEPPEYLSDEAKVHWKFILAHEGGGWIKQCDRAMFELYCEQWAELTRSRDERKKIRLRLSEIEQQINRFTQSGKMYSVGELLKMQTALLERDNFLAGLIVKSTQPFKSVAAELGFTPSSRSRIIATGEEPGVADNGTMSLFDLSIEKCLAAELDYGDSVT